MTYTTYKMTKYMREKRKERREKGLCYTCGGEKPEKENANCQKCIRRAVENKKKRGLTK